jgi:F0F1-type ATP synthase membrane subunit a
MAKFVLDSYAQSKFLKYVFLGLTFPFISLFFLLIKPQPAYSSSGVQSFIEEVFRFFAPELLKRFLEQNPIILWILFGITVALFLIPWIIDFLKK